MAIPFIVASTVLLTIVINYLYSLYRNYVSAKELGIPIILCPVGNWSLVWLFNQAWLLPLFKALPAPLNEFTKYFEIGWQYADRHSKSIPVHERLGPAFVLVTPDKNEIVVSDPVAIHDILTQYRTFVKPWHYQFHELFGKNVNTVNGNEWTRHRKITQPAFNERVSETVWEEAADQAQAMLDLYTANATSTDVTIHTNLRDDTKTIALHVLMSAALGIQKGFGSGVTKPGLGHHMSFADALNRVLEVLPLASLAQNMSQFLQNRVFPKALREAALCYSEVKRYLNEMIVQEQEMALGPSTASSNKRANLLESLMKASVESEANETNTKYQLSPDDVRGNLYIFNFAGHETTANALCQAIPLLAAYPEWQDWIMEEIDCAVKTQSTEYEKLFPRLKRCLALMYEVLRLCPSITFIPRMNAETPVHIPFCSPLHGKKSSKQELVVGDSCYISVNVYNLNFDEAIWGSDANVFRPGRFIDPIGSTRDGWTTQGPSEFFNEQLVAPPLGSFTPWNAGARICPGMKFAQVEFVSVLYTLFSQARVHAVLPGDPAAVDDPVLAEQARAEMKATVQDCAFKGSTLQMRHPEQINLRWSRR